MISVFIIWAARTDRAYKAAMRYLIIQILSGVLLAAGAVVRAAENGSVDFGAIGWLVLGGSSSYLHLVSNARSR